MSFLSYSSTSVYYSTEMVTQSRIFSFFSKLLSVITTLLIPNVAIPIPTRPTATSPAEAQPTINLKLGKCKLNIAIPN